MIITPPEESVAAWCASKPVIVSQQLADAIVVALRIRGHDGNRGGHLTTQHSTHKGETESQVKLS